MFKRIVIALIVLIFTVTSVHADTTVKFSPQGGIGKSYQMYRDANQTSRWPCIPSRSRDRPTRSSLPTARGECAGYSGHNGATENKRVKRWPVRAYPAPCPSGGSIHHSLSLWTASSGHGQLQHQQRRRRPQQRGHAVHHGQKVIDSLPASSTGCGKRKQVQ